MPTRLSALMLTRGGSIDPRAFPDEEFDLYSIPAYDACLPERVAGAEIGSAKQVVEPGDVLLSKIVPHIRRAWTVAPAAGRRLIASGEWIVFRGSVFEPAYLRHFLLSDVFHVQFMQTVAGVGGSLMRARPAFVGRISVPLPPMEEQRRIAAILDQADAVRTKRRAAASQVAALCPALFGVAFGEVFGARTRWPMVRLDDALLQIDSGTSPVCLDRPAVEDEWSVLKLGAISSLIFQPGQNKALKPGTVPNPNHEVHAGDVLFSRKNTRELVGASVYVEEAPPHLLLPDLIFRLVPVPDGPLDPVYLKAALSTRAGREALRGLSSGSAASMVNISKGRLGGLEVAAPARALQAAFASRMAEVRALQKSLSAQARETDALFASLRDRAFKGEL